MTDWKQYDSESSILALKKLAQEEESESRKALLEAARDSRKFVPFVRSLIDDNGGKLFPGKECPNLEKMDEACFKSMTWKIQGREFWNSMKDMPPIVACRPGLWLYVVLHAVESGAIESHFLAAHANGQGQTGLARIEDALRTGDNLATGRMVLRRMFGVISMRTSNAIFVDIPFAKVWWQRYIAEDIAKSGVNITADDMTNFFSEQGYKSVWEELALRMSAKLTVIADKPTRDGLMHFFFHAAKSGNSPPGFSANAANFALLVRRLGVMLAWRAMGAMEAQENSGIVYECASEIGRGEFA